MKKILSLVLVVLMLASLAISASAATINNPFKPDSNDVKFESLLDYYMWLYLSQGNKTPELDETTPVWYDQCPRCGNVAMFFESGNKMVWTCLAKDCNKSGFYPIVEEETTTAKATCTKCKKNTNVFGVIIAAVLFLVVFYLLVNVVPWVIDGVKDVFSSTNS